MQLWSKVLRWLPEAVGALLLVGLVVGVLWAVRAPHRARQLVVLSTLLLAGGLFAAGLGGVMHWLDLEKTWRLQQVQDQAELLAEHPLATGAPWRLGLGAAALAWGMGLALLSVGLRRLRAGSEALLSRLEPVGGAR
jgi:hypothetical protein